MYPGQSLQLLQVRLKTDFTVAYKKMLSSYSTLGPRWGPAAEKRAGVGRGADKEPLCVSREGVVGLYSALETALFFHASLILQLVRLRVCVIALFRSGIFPSCPHLPLTVTQGFVRRASFAL